MGPEVTLDLFGKVLKEALVRTEKDHFRTIIDNNPKLLDRSLAALSGQTARVIALLQEIARNLERAGADSIGIPCNAAHYFFPPGL